MGITIITCSGVSNTGKLTTRTGLTLVHRHPGRVSGCIQATKSTQSLKKAAENAERILALDGCEDCCGRKKLESLGLVPGIHIIATECGIVKRGTDEPAYEEIESLASAVKEAIK